MKIMRIVKNVLLTCGIIFCLGNVVAFAGGLENRVEYGAFEKITIDGEVLQLEKEPFSVDGNRMLPLRNVCESLGCDISWDEETRTIEVTRDDDTLLIGIGDNTIVVNGEAKKMRVAPIIVDGRTYVTPSIIQVGLGDEVEVNDKGDFEITNKSKINKQSGVENVRKTIYKEDENGYVIGVAQINIPHLDNRDGENGIDKINEYFSKYLDEYWDISFCDMLEGELRELETDEFVDTEYINEEVVFNGENVVSIESPTFHGGSARGHLVRGLMFDKRTGEMIRNNEIFKEDTNIYEVVVSAHKNGDKELIKVIEEIKREIKAEKDIWKDAYSNDIWSCWGVKNEEDEAGMLYYISDRIKSVLDDSDSSLDNWCWISIEDNELVLNFRYYAPASYRYASICLDNVLECMNPNLNNLLGKYDTPVQMP